MLVEQLIVFWPQRVEDRRQNATLKTGGIGQQTKALTGGDQLFWFIHRLPHKVQNRGRHHRPFIRLGPASGFIPTAQVAHHRGCRVQPRAPPAVARRIAIGQ